MKFKSIFFGIFVLNIFLIVLVVIDFKVIFGNFFECIIEML